MFSPKPPTQKKLYYLYCVVVLLMLLHLFLQKHLDILKLKKNNINILSIEDDKPTNLLLYKMFSTLQCNITCYFNGYDSLLYLNNNIDKINIIILDYILPDINCMQMLYMINEIILQKKCLNPPIIISVSQLSPTASSHNCPIPFKPTSTI